MKYFICMFRAKLKKIFRRYDPVMLTAAALAVVVISAFGISWLANVQYRTGITMIREGQYQQAHTRLAFLSFFDYGDSEVILRYCDARIAYEEGDYRTALRIMDDIADNRQLRKLFLGISGFIGQALAKNYESNFPDGNVPKPDTRPRPILAPYVGMPECLIESTELGKPCAEVRHNYECIGGQQYYANIYDFKVGNKVIFTARCVNRDVTEIWDWREWPEPTYIPTYREPDQDNDPYNVNDYSNEIDFYDDNKDNFIDYYAAERYFEEHHE